MTPPTTPPLDDDLFSAINEELFGESFDTLESHIARKQALADETRYAILFFIVQNDEVRRPELTDVTEFLDSDFESVIQPLVDVNLLARVPGPTGVTDPETSYRATTLGEQEIHSDREHVGTVPDEAEN